MNWVKKHVSSVIYIINFDGIKNGIKNANIGVDWPEYGNSEFSAYCLFSDLTKICGEPAWNQLKFGQFYIVMC